MRLAPVCLIATLAALACGGEPAPLPVVQPKVGSFGATYGLLGGHVGGAPLEITTATGTAGFARLDYYAGPGTATFHFAACLQTKCGAPGAATGYTAPVLRLESYRGGALTFVASAAAVTVTATGVQNGVPFDLDAQGAGEPPFRVFGTVYPFR